MYDYESVYKKIIHLRKEHDESVEYFHDHFIHLCYEFSKDDIYHNFMKYTFQYLIHIYLNPYNYEYFKSISTFIGYGALKSSRGKSIVPCEFSTSCD